MNKINYPIKVYRVENDGFLTEKTITRPSDYSEYLFDSKAEEIVIVPNYLDAESGTYSTNYKKTLKEAIKKTELSIEKYSKTLENLQDQLCELKRKERATWRDPWILTAEQRDLDEQINGDDDDLPY